MHGTVSKVRVVSVTGEGAQRMTVRAREYVRYKVAEQGVGRVGDVTRTRKDEWAVGDKRAEGIIG